MIQGLAGTLLSAMMSPSVQNAENRSGESDTLPTRIDVENHDGGQYLLRMPGESGRLLLDRTLFHQSGHKVLIVAPKDIAQMHARLASDTQAFYNVDFPEDFEHDHLANYFNALIHLSILTGIDSVQGGTWALNSLDEEDAETIESTCWSFLEDAPSQQKLSNASALFEFHSRRSLVRRRSVHPIFSQQSRTGVAPSPFRNFRNAGIAFGFAGGSIGVLEQGMGNMATISKAFTGGVQPQSIVSQARARPSLFHMMARTSAEGMFGPANAAFAGAFGGQGFASHVGAGFAENGALRMVPRPDVFAKQIRQVAKGDVAPKALFSPLGSTISRNPFAGGLPLALWGSFFHLNKQFMGGVIRSGGRAQEPLTPGQTGFCAALAGRQLAVSTTMFNAVPSQSKGSTAPEIVLQMIKEAPSKLATVDVKLELRQQARQAMSMANVYGFARPFIVVTTGLTAFQYLQGRSGL